MKQARSARVADELGSLIGRLWAAHGIQGVAQVLRDGARQCVGADGITLVLREGSLCHYVDEDAIGPLWKGRYFPLEACISGWAMLHRQQVAVPDILRDARIPQDAYRSTFVKSLVMTPIRSRDPIGALGAYWRERHEATEAELGVLQGLADASASAISARRADRSPGKPRVLLAATPAVAKSLREALAGEVEARAVDTPQAAMAAFLAERPDVAIIGFHFDAGRPDRLVREIRERDAQVPILLVRGLPFASSAARDADVRASYLALGVTQYLVIEEATVGRGSAANRAALVAAVRALLPTA